MADCTRLAGAWLFQNHHAKRYTCMNESARRIAGFLGAAALTFSALTAAITIPSAAAAACPDVEVVFARGTNEPPGVGGVGQAFVDSLRSQVGGRSVGVYAVNYPATDAFASSSAVNKLCHLGFATTSASTVRSSLPRSYRPV